MTSDYLQAMLAGEHGVNPLFESLGLRLLAADREGALLCCVARPDLMQGGGVLAGGVLATLLDEAMAHAVLPRLENGGRTATVEMSVRYLRPVQAGATLDARAWVLKQGRAIITTEAEVQDQQGCLVAKAAASFMVLGAK